MKRYSVLLLILTSTYLLGQTPNFSLVEYNKTHFDTLSSSSISLMGNPKNTFITITRDNNHFLPISFTYEDGAFKLDSLKRGYYNVNFFKKGYESKSIKLLLFPNKEKKYNFLLKPITLKKAIIYSSIFAGAGQFYSQEKYKGYVYSIFESILLTGLITSQFKYNSLREDFRKKRKKYRFSTEIDKLDKLYSRAKRAYKNAKNMQDTRNLFVILYAIIHITNIVDVASDWPFLYTEINNSQNFSNTKTLGIKFSF